MLKLQQELKGPTGLRGRLACQKGPLLLEPWHQTESKGIKKKKKISILHTFKYLLFNFCLVWFCGWSSYQPVCRALILRFRDTLGSGGYHFSGSDLIVLFDWRCKWCSCSVGGRCVFFVFFLWEKSISTKWDFCPSQLSSLPGAALVRNWMICTAGKEQRGVRRVRGCRGVGRLLCWACSNHELSG